jgi:hypothetical protein
VPNTAAPLPEGPARERIGFERASLGFYVCFGVCFYELKAQQVYKVLKPSALYLKTFYLLTSLTRSPIQQPTVCFLWFLFLWVARNRMYGSKFVKRDFKNL